MPRPDLFGCQPPESLGIALERAAGYQGTHKLLHEERVALGLRVERIENCAIIPMQELTQQEICLLPRQWRQHKRLGEIPRKLIEPVAQRADLVRRFDAIGPDEEESLVFQMG
jgi:hypothetical protein